MDKAGASIPDGDIRLYQKRPYHLTIRNVVCLCSLHGCFVCGFDTCSNMTRRQTISNDLGSDVHEPSELDQSNANDAV